MIDANGEEVGFIFVDYTEDGCRVQTVILECTSYQDARQKADDQLRSRGFTVNRTTEVLSTYKDSLI